MNHREQWQTKREALRSIIGSAAFEQCVWNDRSDPFIHPFKQAIVRLSMRSVKRVGTATPIKRTDGEPGKEIQTDMATARTFVLLVKAESYNLDLFATDILDQITGRIERSVYTDLLNSAGMAYQGASELLEFPANLIDDRIVSMAACQFSMTATFYESAEDFAADGADDTSTYVEHISGTGDIDPGNHGGPFYV